MSITLLITFLFLIAICFIFLNYKKTGYLFFIIGFTVFYFTANGMIGSLLINDLESGYLTFKTPQWGQRNAIILLGAGTVKTPSNEVKPTMLAYSRIDTAASLYTACKAGHRTCTIIISGGDASKTGQSEALVYKETLQKLNIKSSDIQLETQSMNTYQNAEYTQAILSKGRYDRIFLVTSAIHLKRSLMYFAHFNVHPIPVPADYMMPRVGIIPNGYYIAITDFAFHEYLGIKAGMIEGLK